MAHVTALTDKYKKKLSSAKKENIDLNFSKKEY